MPDDSVYAPFSVARRDDGTPVELGRGAMGVTYRATDSQLNRTVALKVINAAYLGDAIARQRFLSEARAAAQLNHPNVAGVYHLRAEGEHVFYAMEFVEGENLESYLRKHGSVAPRLALRVILQAAQGLAAANERGLIHRDIKPSNLMLARAPAPAVEGPAAEEDDGLLVKVIDFGLAKNVSENSPAAGLTGSHVVGTTSFMSPEQITPDAESPLDCRTDIYSLGVTLWYLLTGRAPFAGSEFEVLSQHLQKPPPLEDLRQQGVPLDIVVLIGSMLAKDRNERPVNHPALIATLKKILRGGGSSTSAVGAMPAGPASDATIDIPARSITAGSTRPATAAKDSATRGGGMPRWVVPALTGILLLGGVWVWRPWVPRVEQSAVLTAAAPAASGQIPEKNIAVLAFENLSDDKSNEYFSDGISEELLTVLQKIPGLRVAARTSAFSFKGKNVGAQEIGKQLGVAQIVDGSVRKSGNTVRIAARLTRADTGEQVWSENYTRDLKDVFAVQTEIARTIVEQLRGRFDSGADAKEAKARIQSEVKVAEKGGTRNLEAYQQFMRGRFLANEFSSESLAAAATSLRKAVAEDPKFALAWAALSETISLQMGWDSQDRPTADFVADARVAASKALAIEPDLPEALLARAQIQVEHDFDWKGAEPSVRRILAQAPSNARAVTLLGEIELAVGTVERALDLAAQAEGLDPLNPVRQLNRGWQLMGVGRFAEAEAVFRRALEINPAALAIQSQLGLAVFKQGRGEEALALVSNDAAGWAQSFALAIIYGQMGKRAEADAALADLQAKYGQGAAYQVAQVHALRGDNDQAFAWLERARAQFDPGIMLLRADLMMKTLQADPRWTRLLEKLGMPTGAAK